MTEWLGPLPASNFMVGRLGNPVALIVDHWMAGSFASALARFQNPASQVSAHYLIGTDGRIAQVVNDDDTAFHAGDFSVNLLSIGIEHEAGPSLAPSDALYAASVRLHRELAARHDIDLAVGTTVKPHRSVVPTQCPGTLDLERIVKEATMPDSPSYAGQSADLSLIVGEVGMVSGIWTYPSGNRFVQRKVYGLRPGRFIYTIHPQVDPDADPTEDLSAQPAIFVVDVR